MHAPNNAGQQKHGTAEISVQRVQGLDVCEARVVWTNMSEKPKYTSDSTIPHLPCIQGTPCAEAPVRQFGESVVGCPVVGSVEDQIGQTACSPDIGCRVDLPWGLAWMVNALQASFPL